MGLHLVFIGEEDDGLGGSAYDVYRVTEAMASIDLGIATGVLATFLGADPIVVGGTKEQKHYWMSRIANEGLLVAYGATEPQAGSDLAQLKTKAVPVLDDDGTLKGYKITGRKQWISNGGVAEIYTILAAAPGGPSWFVVEKDAEGFCQEQARRQTWHSRQQHSGALPRRCLRGRRPAHGAGRRSGAGPGPGCLRLHPPDGGCVWSRRRLGSTAARRSGTARPASRAAPR